MTASPSYVYVGLAGETAPGRVIKAGLYRMADGDDGWESLTRGLPEAPAIRAIAVHPHKPEIVYAGTQEGPYRSTDHGDHWEKVDVQDHGLPVWSLLFHPGDADVMYAGYEHCEIYRSDDGGEHWQQLPVHVRFPEVTVAPGSNPAKRVLMLAGSRANPNALYGAVEVGGIIRTLDGGEHWENLSHGQYLTDDTVDMHGVLVSSQSPETVYSICRAGLFRSTDRGGHWLHVRLEALNARQQIYCRSIREVPGDPPSIWVAAGAGFQSDVGALFRSTDGGMTWARVDMGVEPASTMFTVAFDERQPSRVHCATNGGETFASHDGGQTWRSQPLPEGATQVYAMACG
ncbi:Ycf48-like protein [Candidatus Entotheonellaceae bacterium PAL068K]